MGSYRGIWNLVLLLICFIPFTLPAQTDSTTSELFRIELTDGSVLIGTILYQGNNRIEVLTQSGVRVEINKSQVADFELYNAESEDDIWDGTDPNSSRLFLTPTGRPVQKGQAYFTIYELFFPFIGGGITDAFSLAGGVSLVPGAETQMIYIAPKITPYHNEKVFFSAGGYLLVNPTEGETFGLVYGAATVGDSDNGVTIGLGYDFEDGEFTNHPIIVLGGELRISQHIKFISENWIVVNNDGNLLSFGLRFFGENFAGDFALIYPTDSSGRGFPFLPWVGFSYNF